jgi:hypothetical protein
VCARAQYSAFCTLHIYIYAKENKKKQYANKYKSIVAAMQPSDFCRTMAECDDSAVISENPLGMDSSDVMDTS